MTSLRETRRLDFTDKIIGIIELRKLANTLVIEAQKVEEDNLRTALEFKVRSAEGAFYESNHASIFDNDSNALLSRVNNVKMSLDAVNKESFEREMSIRIEINETTSNPLIYYSNRIVVSGLRSTWVNGQINIFEQILRAFPPQARFIKLLFGRFSFVAGAIVVASVYYLGFIILNWLFSLLPSSIDLSSLSFILSVPKVVRDVLYFAAFLFNAQVTGKLISLRVNDLWPSVELQVGPDHLLIQKQRRAFLVKFGASVLLPVVFLIIELLLS